MERFFSLRTRAWCVGLLLLGTFLAEAREGYVRTRKGQVYEGHVRFESNAVVVVSAARELWARIRIEDIAALGMASTDDGRFLLPPRPDGVLPEPWTSADVGFVREAGEATWRSGGFRLRSSGTNVIGKSDSFQFVHRPVEGAYQLLGRVVSPVRGPSYTLAGFTMRESLESEARQVSLLVNSGREAVLVTRDKPGAPVRVVEFKPVRVPCWLKLTRAGTLFSAFTSPDGRRWTLVGKTHVLLPDQLLAGAGAASEEPSVTAEIEQVREGRGVANDWYIPQVRLLGGSIQVGRVVTVDDSTVGFNFSGSAPVATRSVSSIQFRPVPQKVARRIHGGQPGVYLSSGEFVSGEIRELRHGQVTMSSIPLGLLHFDVEAELMALVLRKPGPVEQRPCRLTTFDGSVWLATSMSIEGDWVVLREPSFGLRRVPLYEVAELSWGTTS